MERQLVGRKRDGALAMLDVREALLFGRRHDAPVFDEAGSRVMKRRIDPERIHAARLSRILCFPIPKGGTRRAYSQAGYRGSDTNCPGPPRVAGARLRAS